MLDEAEGTVVVQEAHAVEALLGRSTTGKGAVEAPPPGEDPHVVSVDDAATWRPPPSLRAMLHADELSALVSHVRTKLKETKGKCLRTAKTEKGVDVTELMLCVMDALHAALVQHKKHLQAAFAKFDPNGNGLDYQEFGRLIDWCCPASGEWGMTEKEKCAVFQKVEGKEGDGDEDNDEINDPVAFSDGMTRSSAAIAYPRACRDYWRME